MAIENFKRRVVLSLVSSYTSQLATIGANIGSKLILARLIAPSDLGTYALALLVLGGSDMLVDLGVSKHLIRERERPYGNVFLMRLLFGGAVFVGLQLFAGSFTFLSPSLPPVLRAMAVIALIKAASWVPNIYMERELIIHRSVGPQILRLSATALVSIGLAYFHFGVWALVWGTVAGEAIYALAIWRAAAGRLHLELTWRFTRRLIWESRYLFLIGLTGFVLQQGDIAVVGTVLNSTQVGYYSMAYSLVVLLSRVVETAIYRVIYPMFCEYADDPVSLGQLYRRATLAITAVEAPIYFYLLFNAPGIVSILLGNKWMPAALIMQWLAVWGVINPFCTFGSEVLRAKKRDGVLTISTVVGAVVLVVSGYLLTKAYGTVGMAAANYLIVGSIPTIVAVYRIVPMDFRKLARQLATVYPTSFAVIGLASAILWTHPYARLLATGLLVPACWYIYYRVFEGDLGKKTVSALRSRESEVAEV
ncbi:MAG: oligosaccharide flippase family protein [Armatimonadota bacterium]